MYNDESVTSGYLMTSDGKCYAVDRKAIARDTGEFINVSNTSWNKLSHNHVRFGASVFLDGITICPSEIVVLRVLHESARSTYADQAAAPLSIDPAQYNYFWFVRIGVDAQSHYYLTQFGKSFLWQMPFNHVAAVCQSVSDQAKRIKLPEGALAGGITVHMKPSFTQFEPKLVASPWLTKVTSLQQWEDRVFFMSVKPGIALHPLRNEGLPKRTIAMNRPESFQNGVLDVSSMPEDVSMLIIDAVSNHFINESFNSDFKMLCTMRLVCSSFNHSIKKTAAAFCNSTCDKLVQAVDSQSVAQMHQVRSQLLPLGVPVLQIFKDSYRPDFYTYLRWRGKKDAGSMPPARILGKIVQARPRSPVQVSALPKRRRCNMNV